MAFFYSTTPNTCDEECLYHGVCTTTGCICPPGTNTTVGWEGSTCQTIIPPEGYNAYLATLVFSPLDVPESFYLNLYQPGNWSWYLYDMPREYSTSPYIPVQNFYMDEYELNFELNNQVSQLMIQVWVVAPDDEDYLQFGSVFFGSSSTMGKISFAGYLPVYFQSYSIVILPNY